jgi:hypothetical protein
MSFQPNWRYNSTGWYPVEARKSCITCHETFAKKHGVRQVADDPQPMSMVLFLFGTGPYCYWCGLKAWQDKEFFNRSGSNEYAARRHDLSYDFRVRMPSIEEELRKL